MLARPFINGSARGAQGDFHLGYQRAASAIESLIKTARAASGAPGRSNAGTPPVVDSGGRLTFSPAAGAWEASRLRNRRPLAEQPDASARPKWESRRQRNCRRRRPDSARGQAKQTGSPDGHCGHFLSRAAESCCLRSSSSSSRVISSRDITGRLTNSPRDSILLHERAGDHIAPAISHAKFRF